MSELPLTGMRVVSMAELYPGPYATLLLSELGAEVIQVERTRGGDPARRFPVFHEALNRGKRSVALDLKDPAAREAVLRLTDTADVVMEGFRPGVVDRLGVGEQSVRARNQAAVWVSISGFGQTGEHRDSPGHDVSYQAVSGLLHDRLDSDVLGPPPRVAVGDLSSGMFAAIAALSGIVQRLRTGQGSTYDIAMTDGLMSWLTADLFAAANGHGQAELPPHEPGYGLFRTADGVMTLSITHEDHFWRGLCAALGLDELAGFDTAARTEDCLRLRSRVQDVLATRTNDEWARILGEADVPHAPVLSLAEVVSGALVRDRGLLVSIAATADRPARWHLRQPVTPANAPHPDLAGSPALGQHTRDLLASAGLTGAEIDELVARGAATEAR